MSLMLAHHGRRLFRQLAWREMCASTPASMIPVHVGRVIQAAKGQNTRSNVDSSFARSLIPHICANFYATSVGRPKAHTGKRQAKKKSKPLKGKAKTTGKPKPKPKSKKTKKTGTKLTAEQKEAREAREKRPEIRELKTVVLKEPKKLAYSTWTNYVVEYLRGAEIKGGNRETVRATFREASQKFKMMSPEELEVRFPTYSFAICLTSTASAIPVKRNRTRMPMLLPMRHG
jgi:hypothetical protein